MENYILDTWSIGNRFDTVSKKAKEIATEKSVIVEFDFNEIKCLVSKDTALDLLFRDYMNAWIMECKVVGPDCLQEYDPETLSELDRRKKLQEEKEEERRKKQEEEDLKQRNLFEEKTKGVEIELSDSKAWNDGACCVEYAEGWAKLMQAEIAQGKTIVDCAEKTSYELGYLGITGFMYGAAVSMLSQCWKYGEELRQWHNKQYHHEGDGVVNPAVMTITSK